MTAMPTAIIGYTSNGTSTTCGTCARKIRMARALTKPTITERGMKRMSRATPATPSRICRTPASRTVAIR